MANQDAGGPVPRIPVPAEQLLLRDSDEIQGNILAGFNKPHQTFVFLSFGGEADARRWLGQLLAPDPGPITTTREVVEFRRLRDAQDPPPVSVWTNVSLTTSGLLGLDGGLKLPRDEAFRTGAAGRAELLGDRGADGPENWVIGRPEHHVDALLTVAGDYADELSYKVKLLRDHASGCGLRVVGRELQGDRLPAPHKGQEHFGFEDGISQPGVRGFTPAFPRKGGDGEIWEEDADNPGTRVLPASAFVFGEDPRQDATAWMRNGSFQVFRRLVQDVAGWREQMRRLSGELFPDAGYDVMAAKAIGRWPSGSPLALAPDRDECVPGNDFTYADDRAGMLTPRFAHIRKMNPRDNVKFDDDAHRILRRGIPFGAPFKQDARGPRATADRGLLFNAFMASIENQFEFLQRCWANNPRFPSKVLDHPPPWTIDGVDPVISPPDGRWLVHRSRAPDMRCDLRRFVRTTGTIYAFAPSITTLGELARGRASRML
jgi:Dyp-type peroxidase family